jgi:hypothetical protein
MSVVLPAEGDLIVLEGEETMVGDGCSFDRSVALCFSVIWRNRTGFLLSTHIASFDYCFG